MRLSLFLLVSLSLGACTLKVDGVEDIGGGDVHVHIPDGLLEILAGGAAQPVPPPEPVDDIDDVLIPDGGVLEDEEDIHCTYHHDLGTYAFIAWNLHTQGQKNEDGENERCWLATWDRAMVADCGPRQDECSVEVLPDDDTAEVIIDCTFPTGVTITVDTEVPCRISGGVS